MTENNDTPGKPQEARRGDETKDVTFFSLLNPKEPRSDSELAESRLAICRTCDFFNLRLEKCTKCGCFMKLKTTLERAKCPIGHW